MINYKDFIDEKFFVYTSQTSRTITNRLFGYITVDGILTNKADCVKHISTEQIIHEASGAYIYFRVENSIINILRDSMGLCQIYYYEDEQFWAISNSLWKLTEALKGNVKLTINSQVAESLIVNRMMHLGIGESLINEIKTVPIFAKVYIDQENRLVIEDEYRLQNRVELDSVASMKSIDEWISKWGKIYKGLEIGGWNMQIELSGGFDSRAVFSIVKAAGIDFEAKNIVVQSNLPEEKVSRSYFEEDYEIASSIANDFGFKVNTNVDFDAKEIPIDEYENVYRMTLADGVNQFINPGTLYKDSLVRIGGHLGETIRGYWGLDTFASHVLNLIEREITYGTLTNFLNSMDKAFLATGNDNIDAYVNCEYILMETLDVLFFGKQIERNLLSNIVMLSPFMDYSVRGMNVDTSKREVFYIIIMLRTCPELLNYPFDRGQKYSSESIEYAKALCEKYPSQVNFDDAKPIKYSNFIEKEIIFEKNRTKDFLANQRQKFVQNISKKLYDNVFGEPFATAICRNSLNKFDSKQIYHWEDQMLALVTIGDYMNQINQNTSSEHKYSYDVLLNVIKKYKNSEGIYQCFLNFLIQKSAYDNEELLKKNDVYIYGRGEWAKKIKVILDDLKVPVKGYIVTHLENSMEETISIDQFVSENKTGIIVPGVSALYYDEIIAILREKEVKHIEVNGL